MRFVVSCFWLFHLSFILFFFFNDTATTEIYTLSLHDALPILSPAHDRHAVLRGRCEVACDRSEEHTSELQSRQYLVCRLLLEKKKQHNIKSHSSTTTNRRFRTSFCAKTS